MLSLSRNRSGWYVDTAYVRKAHFFDNNQSHAICGKAYMFKTMKPANKVPAKRPFCKLCTRMIERQKHA